MENNGLKGEKIEPVDDFFEKLNQEKDTWYTTLWWFLRYKIKGFFAHDITYKIRRFWQRGVRGWANSDCWSLDYSLAKVITDTVKYLRDNSHGYPTGLTPAKWRAILDKIIYTFEISQKISEDNLYLIEDNKERQKWQKTLKNIKRKHGPNGSRCMSIREIKKYNEGWENFREFYHNLWD